MNPDHIPPFALGVLIGAWAALAGQQYALKRQLKREKAEAELVASLGPTSKSIMDKIQPTPSDRPTRWWADPSGHRIELANTGFYITFNPSEPRQVYQGHTPEHFCISSGLYLDQMKQYMEDRARERAEFTPRVGGWKP
jgi:hypothetical protein